MYSDELTGAFRLSSASESPVELEARAWGYHPKTVRLAGWDPDEWIEIRLEPTRVAAVLVVHPDGTPAPGLRVEWGPALSSDPFSRAHPYGWLDVDPPSGEGTRRTVTDAGGRAESPAPGPLVAWIEDLRSAAHRAVRVLPDQELQVVLPAEIVPLRLVDLDTNEPCVGLELSAWFPRSSEAMPVRLVSDAEGLLRVGVVSWPLLLRRPGSAVWQAELVPLSPGQRRVGFGGDHRTQLQIDRVPVGSVSSIGVRACGPPIRLVDRQSAEPVRGAARLAVRSRMAPSGRPPEPGPHTLESPRSSFPGIDEVFEVHDGELLPPCFLHDPGPLLAGTDPERVLVIHVAGYRPHEVRGPEGAPCELVRARRRILRLVHPDGTPAVLELSIHSPQTDSFCFRSPGSADGLYGPFDWFGGPLMVHGSRPTGTWWIPAEELETDDVVSRVVPAQGGSLVVEGVPEAALDLPWIAKVQDSMREHRPSRQEGDRVRFERLPVGSYLVGPRDWVLGAEPQSIAPSVTYFADHGAPRSWRHLVEEGRETVVRWEPSWAAAGVIEGRVTMRGPRRGEPFLVPIYGPGLPSVDDLSGTPPTLRLARSSPRIPLDPDGRYRVRELDPLPFLIAVCTSGEVVWGSVGGLLVHDWIRPGESLEIRTAAIELHWEQGDMPAPLEVEFEIAPESYRYAIRTPQARSRTTWAPGSVLLLDHVPLHVDRLRIAGRELPVRLSAEETQRIAVDSGTLEALDRSGTRRGAPAKR